MKKKKIGIVIPSLNHGGAEKSALILANKLQSEYESVDLISLCRNSKKIENESVNLISLNKTRVLFSIFQLFCGGISERRWSRAEHNLLSDNAPDCIGNLFILVSHFFCEK